MAFKGNVHVCHMCFHSLLSWLQCRCHMCHISVSMAKDDRSGGRFVAIEESGPERLAAQNSSAAL